MDKKLFNDLIRSMEEMIEIENGESIPAPENVHIHEIIVPLSSLNSIPKDAE